MHRISYGILFITLLSFSACQFFKTSEKEENGVQRSYYPDGKIHKEISMKDGKMTGSYKEYYKNGQLFHDINFSNNLREGVAKKYYETGVLSQEIPYQAGKLHGVHKKYRRSGDLMCEIPYHEGNLCVGLKEYTVDGKVKERYPKIVISSIDNILMNGKYSLLISLSDGTKSDVEYFEGQLTDGKYIGDEAGKVWKVENGVGRLDFALQPGMYLMEELHFIAKVKTYQGNFYITEITHHLAIDNKF